MIGKLAVSMLSTEASQWSHEINVFSLGNRLPKMIILFFSIIIIKC